MFVAYLGVVLTSSWLDNTPIIVSTPRDITLYNHLQQMISGNVVRITTNRTLYSQLCSRNRLWRGCLFNCVCVLPSWQETVWKTRTFDYWECQVRPCVWDACAMTIQTNIADCSFSATRKYADQYTSIAVAKKVCQLNNNRCHEIILVTHIYLCLTCHLERAHSRHCQMNLSTYRL